MRLLPCVVALLMCTGCHVRAPLPGVRVSARAPQGRGQARGEAEARAQAQARARVRVRAEAEFEAPPPPPPEERPEPVPLEGATVVEFFGVPLEGTQDVVFVLDRSGSMDDPAQGRIAELGAGPEEPNAGAKAEGSPPADADGSAHAGDTTNEPPPIFADAPDGAASPPPGDARDAPPSAVAPDEPHDASPASAEGAYEPDDGGTHEPDADGADEPTADATDEPDDDSPTPPTPRKIDVARHELVDALERLPDGTRMNVIFFNHRVEANAPGLVALEGSTRDNLIRFVEGIEPANRTALATAMRAAFVMGARHVVVLSDGLGNIGGGSTQILRDAREAMRGGVRIDTIGLGHDQDAALLRALADESGGLYQAL